MCLCVPRLPSPAVGHTGKGHERMRLEGSYNNKNKLNVPSTFCAVPSAAFLTLFSPLFAAHRKQIISSASTATQLTNLNHVGGCSYCFLLRQTFRGTPNLGDAGSHDLDSSCPVLPDYVALFTCYYYHPLTTAERVTDAGRGNIICQSLFNRQEKSRNRKLRS